MPELNLTQPLVFEPLFMERVWGGRRLEQLYGKRLPSAALIGESWEIVDRPEAQSVVHEGPLRGATLHELWRKHRSEIFGDIPDSPRFPLLVKLLDAQENLSLQVHPPERVAEQLGGESKSEFWYVAHATPKARIYAGFKKATTPKNFTKAIEEGRIEKHLHALEVESGDALFVPSGRMHALGAGNVIVEIQENSDTTYRIYDWDRARLRNAPREMHIEQAMECVDFADVAPKLLHPKGDVLLRNEFFEIEKWDLGAEREVAPPGTFAIGLCLAGALECAGRKFGAGDFFLVPAALGNRTVRPIEGDVSLLRVMLPSRKKGVGGL